MPVTDHPFVSYSESQPKKPLLLVRYLNPHTGKSRQTYALIDTGADDCVLPADFAPLLGHDLDKGEPHSAATAGGVSSGFRHTMRLEIDGFQTNECMISFMPNLKTPLLGVRSFLANFNLTINYPSERFWLKKPKNVQLLSRVINRR